MTAQVRLAIDFGTSHTVAVLDPGTGQAQSLLFGDSPLLPSAVHAAEGRLLTGRDAIRSARSAPECFEPNPKRRIDDGTVLLGAWELPVVELIAAVLRTVAVEARRVAGRVPGEVALTHPANWGSARLAVLRQAAEAAGLPRVSLVPEPEAAAVYFAGSQPAGELLDTVVVYDFGGGTFDACVLDRSGGNYRVRAQAGLDDVGGADLDAALFDHIGHVVSQVDGSFWRYLTRSDDADARRALRAVYEDVKATKEQLSRNSSGLVHMPLLNRDFPVAREEFEQVARPIIERTVDLTAGILSGIGVGTQQPVGLYLVGGSSRVPLVSTLLHRRLGRAPVITGQPEQVVAQGALRCLGETGAAPVAAPATRSDLFGPVPSLTEPAAANPTGRRNLVRALVAAGVVAVLAVAAVFARPMLFSGSDGGNDKADGLVNEDGKKSDKPVDVEVSKEPSIGSFMDDDTDKNLGCYYADAADVGHPAECGDRNANRGFTRLVSHYSECEDDPRPEEDGWRSDGDSEIYCQTVLFKKKACLDADFYTFLCDDERAAFVIEDGPKGEAKDCDRGKGKGVVQLKATKEYFCFGRIDA